MIEKIRKNKFAAILASILLIVGIIFVFRNSELINNSDKNELSPTITQAPIVITQAGEDPLKSTYIIEDQTITLNNGSYEEKIPNSSAVILTRNFNEPIYGDLNGIPNAAGEDASFIIMQEPGGSGTFFYVVASISTDEGYLGTNGILLGDRISPQTQEIRDDRTIVVNFAERAEGDSMTDSPSVGVSKYFRVEGENLIEVESPNN